MALARRAARSPATQRLRSLAGKVLGWLTADSMGLGGAGSGESGREQGLPRIVIVFLLIFGVGMILISLVGDQGWIAYVRLSNEAETLSQRIEEAKSREVKLLREIRALQYDPEYIEQIARKQLGLVKPGEIVIEIVPKRRAHE